MALPESRKTSAFSMVSCHVDFSCSLSVTSCMQPSHLNTASTCIYTVVPLSSSKVTCPTICYQHYLSKSSLKITGSVKEFKLRKPTAVRHFIFLLHLLSAETGTTLTLWPNVTPLYFSKILRFWGCSCIRFWHQNPSHHSSQRLKF